MWTCPNCKIDVEPEYDLCWGCGTSRDGEPTPGFDPESEGIMGADEYAAETEAKRQESLVTLATFWNAPEAHILRSRLEAEGVAAVVTDELTGTWGLAINLGTIKVEVPEAQAAKAREVLDSLRQTPPPEERLVAKAVVEGIQIKPSPPVEPTSDGDSMPERSSPVRSILSPPCIMIWPIIFVLIILIIIYTTWLM
jgi:hypothetical protein